MKHLLVIIISLLSISFYGQNSDTAWFNKGYKADNDGKYKEAIKCYTKAIELNPKNDNFYYNRGQAKYILKKYKEAIEDYNKAIGLDSTQADVFCN
jgi:tetratricopeptide (TPR) repeat protein